MSNTQKRLWLIASDNAVANQANDMFRRIREVMIAVDRYTEAITQLDEDAPDLHRKFGALAEQLAQRFVQQYPNPTLFDADLDTLKQMRTEIQPLNRGQHEH